MLLHVNVNVNFNLKVNVSRSRSHSMSLTAIQWQPSNVNDKKALLLFVHPQHHVVCSIVTSVMQNGFPPKNNFWIQTGVWAGSFQDFPGARFHWVNMCRIIFALLLGRGEMQCIPSWWSIWQLQPLWFLRIRKRVLNAWKSLTPNQSLPQGLESKGFLPSKIQRAGKTPKWLGFSKGWTPPFKYGLSLFGHQFVRFLGYNLVSFPDHLNVWKLLLVSIAKHRAVRSGQQPAKLCFPFSLPCPGESRPNTPHHGNPKTFIFRGYAPYFGV